MKYCACFDRIEEQASEARESLEILKLSKETLLLGINDKNTNIR